MLDGTDLLYTVADGVATLTINRPHKLNALSSPLLDRLDQALTLAATDPQVSVLILTGAGPRAFSAGADLDELDDLEPWQALPYIRRGQAIIGRLDACEKPTIAAVNGYALGGGCELALACHLRVAATTARLGLPEARVGMIPGYGGTQRLSRLVGKAKALELALTAEPVDADEALRLGLVNHVVPPERLMATARELAQKIRRNSPLSVRLLLTAIGRGVDLPLAAGLELEANLDAITFGSPDQKEGLRAFRERRPPVWPAGDRPGSTMPEGGTGA